MEVADDNAVDVLVQVALRDEGKVREPPLVVVPAWQCVFSSVEKLLDPAQIL